MITRLSFSIVASRFKYELEYQPVDSSLYVLVEAPSPALAYSKHLTTTKWLVHRHLLAIFVSAPCQSQVYVNFSGYWKKNRTRGRQIRSEANLVLSFNYYGLFSRFDNLFSNDISSFLRQKFLKSLVNLHQFYRIVIT